MSNESYRCPICREVISEATHRTHMRSHSTWQMFKAAHRLDPNFALGVAVIAFVLLAIVVGGIVGLWLGP